jgi:hypothetical protein
MGAGEQLLQLVNIPMHHSSLTILPPLGHTCMFPRVRFTYTFAQLWHLGCIEVVQPSMQRYPERQQDHDSTDQHLLVVARADTASFSLAQSQKDSGLEFGLRRRAQFIAAPRLQLPCGE